MSYGSIMALLTCALDDWSTFDGWCLSRGFDPLKIPSRRLISAIWTWISEKLDGEGRINLQRELDKASLVRNPFLISKPRHLKIVPNKEVTSPKGRFRAPEGWVPPGWSEERSYATAKSFMGWQGSLK